MKLKCQKKLRKRCKDEITLYNEYKDHKASRIKMVEESLFLFALHYFPKMFTCKSPDFHLEWYKLLMFGRNKQTEYFEKLLLLGFRGSAKTSLAKIKVIHSIVFRKHKNIGYVSYDNETSKKALFDLRQWLVGNSRLIEDFGHPFEKPVKDSPEKNTQTTFLYQQSIRVSAFSVKGSARGMQSDFERPTLWVLDDFENDVTKVSATKTQTTKSFINELLTGTGKQPEIIFLGNYISEFGVIQMLLNRAKTDKMFVVSRVDLYENEKLTWSSNYCWTNKEAKVLRDKGIVKHSVESIMDSVRGEDGSLARFYQELLNQPMSEGESYFDLSIIRERLKYIEDIPEVSGWRWFYNEKKQNEMISQRNFFVVSADVSKGIGRDSSVIQVINCTQGIQVGEYVSADLDEHDLGLLMVEIGNRFSALLMPEENNIGIATINAILGENYFDLYRQKDVNRINTKISKRYGFNTNSKTKPLILSDLKRDFQNGILEINSKYLLQEMMLIKRYQLEYKRSNKDQTSHYDRVMAFAIGWHGRNDIPILL